MSPEPPPPTESDTAPRLRLHAALWRVLYETVAGCFRYRITGLAAEAAFFALLSLPPLLLGLIGTLGYLQGVVGPGTITAVENRIVEMAGTVLSERGVEQVVVPTMRNVLSQGRADIVSIGFLIALWSGSRALNVYVDTITIAYGLSGLRGIIRTRLLSFGLYLVGLMLGVVALPLVVAGPDLVVNLFPDSAGLVHFMYWPAVVLLSVAFLNTLYHLSVPVRTPWKEDLPGSVVALLIWVGGSMLLRIFLSGAFSESSVYGPLAAPVAVLLWLYLTALAVLVGASLNAAVDKVWPTAETLAAREIARAKAAEALAHAQAKAKEALAKAHAKARTQVRAAATGAAKQRDRDGTATLPAQLAGTPGESPAKLGTAAPDGTGPGVADAAAADSGGKSLPPPGLR